MGASCTKNDDASKPSQASIDTQTSDRQGFRAGLVKSQRFRSVWESYEKGREIGRGMTGAVYIVRHKITNQEYALKSMEVRKINPDLLDDLRNEISILRLLDHPNVIKLYESYEDERNIYLILEYCSGGELYDRLHEQKNRKYTEEKAGELVFKMLSAIAYCHGMGISHRDLKLENFIFESAEEDSNLKLIDFGLSKKYGQTIRRMTTMVGTPYYMAPEVVDGTGGYTQACDVWSIGVITYMLLSGTPPFRGESDHAVLASVRSAKFTIVGPKWDAISQHAKDFIRALLRKNPKSRPTAEQALQLPFLDATLAAIQSDRLDTSVLESLRRFSQFSTIKRVALETIAFSMSAEKIKKLQSAFIKMDKDRTGFVTFAEMSEILQSEGLSEEETRRIFHDVDRDKRNKISYSEFLAATLDRRYYLQIDRIREAFQRLDVSNTGYIEFGDLQAVLGEDFDEASVKKMLSEADLKGDGRIDFEEFLRVVTDDSRAIVEDIAPHSAVALGGIVPETPRLPGDDTGAGAPSAGAGGAAGAEPSIPPTISLAGEPAPSSASKKEEDSKRAADDAGVSESKEESLPADADAKASAASGSGPEEDARAAEPAQHDAAEG